MWFKKKKKTLCNLLKCLFFCAYGIQIIGLQMKMYLKSETDFATRNSYIHLTLKLILMHGKSICLDNQQTTLVNFNYSSK